MSTMAAVSKATIHGLGQQMLVLINYTLAKIHLSFLWRQFYDETVGGGNLLWSILLLFFAFTTLAKYRHNFDVLAPLRDAWKRGKSLKVDFQWYGLTLFNVFGPIFRPLNFALYLFGFSHLLRLLNWYDSTAATVIRHVLNYLPVNLQDAAIFFSAFLAADLGSYFAHWLSHKSDLLWQFHKVHHYPRQLNILAGFRNHPLDTFIASKVSAIVTTLLASALIVAKGEDFHYVLSSHPHLSFAFIFLPSILQRLTHTNLPIFLGPILGRIFISPVDHMAHHTLEWNNSNYGGSFIFWDKIFGTYHHIKDIEQYKSEAAHLGVSDMTDNEYANIWEAFLIPVRDFFKVLYATLARRRAHEYVPNESEF